MFDVTYETIYIIKRKLSLNYISCFISQDKISVNVMASTA